MDIDAASPLTCSPDDGCVLRAPTTGDKVDPLEFSSKVLFYLWPDVFRDEPGLVFIDTIRTFDMLHQWHEIGRDVFRAEIVHEASPAATRMANATPSCGARPS